MSAFNKPWARGESMLLLFSFTNSVTKKEVLVNLNNVVSVEVNLKGSTEIEFVNGRHVQVVGSVEELKKALLKFNEQIGKNV
jgi:hypothetical protein